MCREDNGCQFVIVVSFCAKGRQQSVPFHLNLGLCRYNWFSSQMSKRMFMNWVSTSAVHPCASGHIMLLSVVAKVVHFCATYFEIRGKHPNCWELNWMCSRWDIISFDVLSLVVPLPTLNSRVFFVFTLLLSLKNGNKNGTNPNKKWRWRWLLNCVECSKQWLFRKRGTARRLLAHVFLDFRNGKDEHL